MAILGHAFSYAGGEVSKDGIEKVLPFLTGRAAYDAKIVERHVSGAFRAVRGAKKGRVFTAKAQREAIPKVIKALAVIERAIHRSGVPPILVEESLAELRTLLWGTRACLPAILSKQSLAEIETRGTSTSIDPTLSKESFAERQQLLEGMLAHAKRRRKAGGKPNLGREIAVSEAYRLLVSFGGKKRPGCTRGGLWNKIANILYEDPDADLFKAMKKFLANEMHLDAEEIPYSNEIPRDAQEIDPDVHE
jgi:hypothetical protein